MRWLVVSIVLSLVLTVLLNVALRAFPDAGHRALRRFEDLAPPDADRGQRDNRRVRVVVPWKAMITVSVILTIVLNLLLWLA